MNTESMLQDLGGAALGLVLLAAGAWSQSVAPAQAGAWSRLNSMPTARSGLGAAAINGVFYAIGGYTGGDTAVVEAYDPATSSWSAAAPLTARNFGYGDAGRYGGSAATLNAKAYMMGGWTINPPLPSSDVSIYDPAQNLWSAGPTLAPATGLNGVSSPYSACSEAASGGGMIFLANFCNGYNGWANNLRILMNNAWVVGPNPPNPHGTGAAAYLNGKFYLAGGTDAAGHPTAALDVYDPQTNTWRTAAGLPVPLTGMAGDVINGKWYVVGGNDSTSAVNTLYIYDPLSDSWSLGPQALTARSGAAAAAINGKLYVAGGTNASGSLATLEVFDPAPNPPPPTVTLLSPASGSSVAGFVTLTATATGNVGSIAYTLDGSGYLNSADITAPYAVYWDTTKVPNGTHTLAASGWDKTTGQWLVASATITVTVGNPVPPPIIPIPGPGPEPGPNTITVLSPAYGASVSSTVVLTAAATGNVGCVAYTLDGSGYLNGCLLTPPYTFSWDTTAVNPGTHTVTAGAWDKTTGAFLIGSAPVIVTVGKPAPPPTVTILTPANNASAAGFVTLTATTTGNVGSIAYSLDGSGFLDSAIITPPFVFYWDTTKVPNGSHTLAASGWDKTTGQWLVASANITVTVNNPVPAPIIPIPAPGPEPGPNTLTVLSPGYGASISSTVVLTAAATGNVVCVAYTLDGSGYLNGCLLTSPYTFSWDTTAVAPGTHTITAGAWDKTTRAFLIGSAPVIVTVGPVAPPPTVTMLTPVSSASVAGFVTLTSTAAGNIGSIAYSLDGSGFLDSAIITPPFVFYWDTTKVPNGTHTLVAGAWDKNTGKWLTQSPAIAVIVNNPVPAPVIPVPAPGPEPGPNTITVLSPAYGASVSSAVVLTAAATGDIGCVAYTLDGSGYLNGCLLTPPYAFSWDTTAVAPGTHTVTAGAWDKTTRAFLVASPPVIVTVGKPAPPATPASLVITSPSGGENWLLGSTQTITWTGGAPAWPMLIQVIDVAKWQVAKTLAVNAPNNGAFPWVVDMRPASYQIYLQGDRGQPDSAWIYSGRSFAVSAPSTTPTIPVIPAPASGLTATSIAGSLIVLNWTPSPTIGVTGYHLYYDAGTGTIDYGSPLAVLASTQTTFTVGPLASSGAYNFALRADLGGVEETTGVFASAASAGTLAAARAAIKTPDAGKHIAGNSVTVSAQLISGGYDQVSQVAFEYRVSGTTSWLLIPAANANHRNPAQSAPFFMQWDVTGLAPGNYDLRAVASAAAGGPDPAPGAITIVVDPVQPDIDENVVGGEDQKRQRINTDVPTVIEASGHQTDGPLAQIMVPSGCLSGSTVTATVVANPPIPASPPPGFSAVGSSLQIDLDNGQHMLLAEQRAQITLSYPDTVVDPENLKIYSLDPATGRWNRDFDSTVNTASRTVSGLTPHFSVFALFSGSALAADLSSVRVYPVPYKPNGSNPDEGKPFSAGDPTSGIVFDNLPAAASIKIYTLTGRKVVELSNSNGTVQWDARNGDGRDVASGGYFAVISAPSQSSVVKKLAIIR